MVDGVKCYDTDRSGNPISTSGSYPLVGYVPWEARTNLCIRSQEFDHAAWTKLAAGTGVAPVVTANYGVAPDGTTTAARVQLNRGAGSGSGNYSKFRNANITGQSNPHTATHSVYMKTVGGGTSNVAFSSSYTGAAIAVVTGTWTRFEVSASVPQTIDGIDIFTRDTIGGDQTADILVWGAQIELGSFATPYIPTTTVAVARNADQLTYSGAALSSLSTEGTIIVSASVADLGNTRRVFDRNTGGPSVPIYYQLGNGFQSFHDGAAARSAGVVGTAGVTAKLALAYGGSTGVMSKNGANQTAQTFDGSFGTITSVSPGGGYAAGQETNGPVTHIYIWNRKLSDSELRVITS